MSLSTRSLDRWEICHLEMMHLVRCCSFIRRLASIIERRNNKQLIEMSYLSSRQRFLVRVNWSSNESDYRQKERKPSFGRRFATMSAATKSVLWRSDVDDSFLFRCFGVSLVRSVDRSASKRSFSHRRQIRMIDQLTKSDRRSNKETRVFVSLISFSL